VATVDDRGGQSDEADRADLGLSFRSLAPWLERNLGRLIGKGRNDVDDVVQESFIRFGRYAVEARSRHPKALLLRIAANVVLDGRRRFRASPTRRR
jgi:DNA-directed RNA polymerase specialized sigma24 family protein